MPVTATTSFSSRRTIANGGSCVNDRLSSSVYDEHSSSIDDELVYGSERDRDCYSATSAYTLFTAKFFFQHYTRRRANCTPKCTDYRCSITIRYRWHEERQPFQRHSRGRGDL